ncbi:MAG: hypothetical protein HC876_18155 [Chloroflexaceae bacterium]|nr:hypothetical protein [Chloroflexaceae bacterium]
MYEVFGVLHLVLADGCQVFEGWLAVAQVASHATLVNQGMNFVVQQEQLAFGAVYGWLGACFFDQRDAVELIYHTLVILQPHHLKQGGQVFASYATAGV